MRDIGGAFYIHTFSGFFGVAATWIYSHKSNCKNNPNNKGNYGTSTLTFLGTFTLFALFPAFNSINPLHNTQYISCRFLAMLNTFFALTSSTVITFWISLLMKKGKLSLTLIQNCSIAGGVIIASSADMFYFPLPALLVGAIAGAIASASMNFLSPLVEKIKLFDTRGILFVHALPGLWSGVISAITAAVLNFNYYGTNVYTW